MLADWPRLHEGARPSRDENDPPRPLPKRRSANPWEMDACKRADIELAIAQLDTLQRLVVTWHYRDCLTYWQISHDKLGGMVGSETVGATARLGARLVIAWLMGERWI